MRSAGWTRSRKPASGVARFNSHTADTWVTVTSSSTPSAADEGPRRGVGASSRYTPKQTKRQLIPPSYIPVIMLVLLIGGGLLIMARYLVFTDTNWPTLIGLAMILGGLYTATKWQ